MAGMPGIVIKVAADTRDAISGLGKVNKALGKTATASQKFGRVAKVGFGLAAAGAVAAGAAFVKVASDAIDAAIEEEKSLAVLHKTMENLGLAAQSAGVDKFIDDLQYAANTADNLIRPAFDRLVRSTGDVAEAQRATAIALDIAAAKDLDLIDVANNLGKAYDGNALALSRMGLGIDRATLQSQDMAKITEELTRLYGGQSAASEKTLGGAIAGVKIAVDELSESFGVGLVGATDDSINSLERTEDTIRRLGPRVEELGTNVHNLAFGALEGYDNFRVFADLLEQHDWGTALEMVKTGAFDSDEAMRALVDSTRTEVEALYDLETQAKIAASAARLALQGEAAVAASVADSTWNASDVWARQHADMLAKQKKFAARYAANVAAGMSSEKAADWARSHKTPDKWVEAQAAKAAAIAKAKADAARAAAKAKAKAKSDADAQAKADDVAAYEQFSPPRYNRSRTMALRRADGRAAQKEARTGSRP